MQRSVSGLELVSSNRIPGDWFWFRDGQRGCHASHSERTVTPLNSRTSNIETPDSCKHPSASTNEPSSPNTRLQHCQYWQQERNGVEVKKKKDNKNPHNFWPQYFTKFLVKKKPNQQQQTKPNHFCQVRWIYPHRVGRGVISLFSVVSLDER